MIPPKYLFTKPVNFCFNRFVTDRELYMVPVTRAVHDLEYTFVEDVIQMVSDGFSFVLKRMHVGRHR